MRPQWHLSGAGKGIASNDSEGRWGPSTACPRISSSRSARPLRKSRTQVAKCLLPATQQVIFTYPRAVWRHNPGNRSRPANLRMLLHCVRRRSALWRGKEGILLTRLAPRGRCNRWCLWGGTDSFSNFSHICHALYSFFAFFLQRLLNYLISPGKVTFWARLLTLFHLKFSSICVMWFFFLARSWCIFRFIAITINIKHICLIFLTTSTTTIFPYIFCLFEFRLFFKAAAGTLRLTLELLFSLWCLFFWVSLLRFFFWNTGAGKEERNVVFFAFAAPVVRHPSPGRAYLACHHPNPQSLPLQPVAHQLPLACRAANMAKDGY